MLRIQSQVIDGFPFAVNTTSFLSEEMKDKFQKAVNIASERLKKENLKNFLGNYEYTISKYRGRLWWRKRVSTKTVKGFHVDTRGDIFDTSIEDILDIIQGGNELALGKGSDGEADVFWKLNDRSKKGVVGYTYTNTIWQWTYKNWAYNMTPEELAGHIVHEWLHKLGGKHAYKRHSLRKHTVVYAVGHYVARG